MSLKCFQELSVLVTRSNPLGRAWYHEEAVSLSDPDRRRQAGNVRQQVRQSLSGSARCLQWLLIVQRDNAQTSTFGWIMGWNMHSGPLRAGQTSNEHVVRGDCGILRSEMIAEQQNGIIGRTEQKIGGLCYNDCAWTNMRCSVPVKSEPDVARGMREA